MTDLETYLKSKLNESIDADLGPARPAPPFEPATPTRTWLRPVLAAASVLIVVGAAVAISRVSTSGHTKPPATTTHSDKSPLSHAPFHGAKIAIPLGWTAHREHGAGAPATLCLSPSKTASACAIQVHYAAPGGQAMLDVDEPGGFYGDAAQICAPKPTPPRKITGTMTRDFGGRQAQWRVWDTDCPGGKTIVDEQFVVPSSPGFVLYAHNPTSNVRDGIAIVAQHSQLPTQNAPLWLTDRGRIQSVSSSVRGGKTIVHLVLARFRPDGSIGNPPTLVSYDLSQSVYQRSQSPQAGATIYLATNGHTVRLIEQR
jgi:hypothetical protein